METPDKNAHLSPLLSDIKDYGPVDEASAGESDRAGKSSDNRAQPHEQDRMAAQLPPAARTGGGARWAMYGLVVLWLLTLGGGFAAFIWQQTRIDHLVSEREAERRTAQRSIAAAETEAARLSDRVQALEAERASLPTARDANFPEATSADTAEAREADAGAMPLGDAEPVAEAGAIRVADSQTSADAGMAKSEADGGAASEEAAEGGTEQASAGSGSVAPVEPVADGWFVNLSTFSTEALAREWLAELPGPPADASVIPVQSNGRQLYRVRIGGFASRGEARAAADRMTTDWEIDGAWISEN